MDAEDLNAIDLTLFKMIGFYQIVDPNSPKVFGFNVYKTINMALIAFTSTMTAIGLSGYFYNTGGYGADSFFKDMQMLFYVGCITVGNLKLIVSMYNAGAVLKLFDVTRRSFLTSAYCRDHFDKLIDCGHGFARVFPYYFFLFFMTAFTWVTMPLVLNGRFGGEKTAADANDRIVNVVNLRYPITAQTYNRFYKGLYVMEAIMCSYCAYGLVVFDLFLIALLKIIAKQYELISSAYDGLKFTTTVENVNGTKRVDYENIRDEFLSITRECQNIKKQLTIIYKMSWPVVLIYMVLDAIGMVTMPFLIAMCFIKKGASVFDTEVLTFLWTLNVAGIQSFMFCNLFQHVNEKRENVNFGIYSCDWTWSDIRIKKLILLTMRVNSSNSLKMNVTPNKYIDLPMLASIVRSSYSITSVMINSNVQEHLN